MAVERGNVPGLAATPGYRHVAVARGSRLVFTAGAVPLDAEGNLVGPEDAVEQTVQAIRNLVAALDAGGAGPEDVVKTTVYVVGPSHERQEEVWRAVQSSAIAAAPSTLVGVALLGHRGQLVEIEAIAVVEDEPSAPLAVKA
jgi:enamine deaminase RidA (YjgF/YER057c/UK114 family)